MTRSSLLFKDAIPGVTYYASGSNHAGEVLGFAQAGIHVGVSARETRDLTEQALCFVVRTYGARVFVDSGAFAELGRNGVVGEAPDWPEVSSVVDAIAYSVLRKNRAHRSNLISAPVDSVVFVGLAFGVKAIGVYALAQTVAKIGGGWVWGRILNRP